MTVFFPEHQWYAVQVKSRFESVVAGLLQQKGFPVLFPTYIEHRRWNDRTKELLRPLFPGYLFCRFDARIRLPILTTPHVMSIVGAGRTPVAVEDGEITAIQGIQRSGQVVRPYPYLGIGQRVRIASGPLQGVEGILTCSKNEYRLVVSVTLLRRSIAVEVDRSAVAPVPGERHRTNQRSSIEAVAAR